MRVSIVKTVGKDWKACACRAQLRIAMKESAIGSRKFDVKGKHATGSCLRSPNHLKHGALTRRHLQTSQKG